MTLFLQDITPTVLEISDDEIDGQEIDREHLLHQVEEAVGRLSLFLAFCFHIPISTWEYIYID